MTSSDQAAMRADSKAPPSAPLWVFASIVLTALLGIYSLYQRYQIESMNKAVGIVADWDSVVSLASGAGMSPQKALEELKKDGLRGLVVGEVTYGETKLDDLAWNTTSADAYATSRFRKGLSLRFPGTTTIDGVPRGLIRSVSLGLDGDATAAAKDANLFVVARIGNPIGVNDAYVKGMIDWAHEDGATFFLPQGDQVLGRRDSMKTLQDALAANQMAYCTPEFAKIGGDDNMVEAIPENLVRLHSAQSQELDKLSLGGAIERYAKAVSERNQRMILVRPLTLAAPNPVEAFGELIGGIKNEIAKENYQAKSPHPFTDSDVHKWLLIAIAAAMSPAIFWLCSLFVPSRTWRIAGALALALMAAGCATHKGPQIAALVAATAFPMLAFVMLDRWAEKQRNWALLYVMVSLVSIVGGICVGGLLNGLPFFVRADVFMGVKLAHFLPIGLIGLYFFYRLTPGREAVRSPILWSQAGLAILILVGFAFMASRTGNDNPAGVSSVELAFRAALEKFLVVRPRTKEFLIGHPAMIVALALLVRHKMQGMNSGGWIALLLMVGAIGQTSMVNTMCHLHTPLTVTVARIGVGWILGGIIGAISWAVVSRIPARLEN